MSKGPQISRVVYIKVGGDQKHRKQNRCPGDLSYVNCRNKEFGDVAPICSDRSQVQRHYDSDLV